MPEFQPFGAFAPAGLASRTIAATRAMADSWTGRRMAYVLRRLGLKVLRGRPVDIETYGARLRLYPDANVCEKRVLFTPQFFDPAEREALAAAMRDDFVFVDIGANVGVYSLFVAAQAGPRARILAVEPQPEVFERLTQNISLNPFGSIKAVACAVADKAGQLTLFLDARNKGEASVKFIAHSQASSIRVPAVTLTGLLEAEGFNRVDAMKLDVEGAEDLILTPFLAEAPDTLLPGLMIIENGQGRWQADLPALLAGRGYRHKATTRLNLIYRRD